MKTLNKIIIVSSIAISTSVLFGSSAFAGGGGMAGSAAFDIDTNAVTGVATAASVGQNGASAWAFQDGTKNSAGAMGSAGVITVTTFNATSVTSVSDTVPGTYTANTNTLTGNADIQLGDASGDVIIQSP